MSDRHYQIHPDHVDEDGNYYAVDTEGAVAVLDADAPADDRVGTRDLSDGTTMLTVPEAVESAVVRTKDVDPDAVPIAGSL